LANLKNNFLKNFYIGDTAILWIIIWKISAQKRYY